MRRFAMVLAALGCCLHWAAAAEPLRRDAPRPGGSQSQKPWEMLPPTEPEILAGLLRRYVVEAFVIPTGAMAPTLLGRHKALQCPQCGYRFRVNASSEIDAVTGRSSRARVVSGTCPMCRFTVDLGPDNPQGKTYRSGSGDRILVSKTAYRSANPQRWDVAVFKYPGDPTTPFVKRVVGLPGETVRISHGDVLIHGTGEGEFTLARKPAEKLRSLLRVVYDNDYVLPEIIRQGWPARWRPWPQEQSEPAGGWVASEDYRSFRADGTLAGDVWLRYQHLVPSYEDWQHLREGTLPDEASPKPQLISDYVAYNTSRTQFAAHPAGPYWDGAELSVGPNPEALGLHWVGDLGVQLTAEVEGPGGEMVFELVEGGRRMQCRIDLADGTATLSIDGRPSFRPAATTRIRGPGTYTILFTNVDDQLTLWVDGQLPPFDAPTTYDPLGNTRPTPADLAPVGVASRGAAVSIRHLKVLRDVYFIAVGKTSFLPVLTDFPPDANPYAPLTRHSVAQFLSDPSRWDLFEQTRQDEFSLDADQFFMLGDNSARSKDGRVWPWEGIPHYVHRESLVGKVLYRYFPRAGIVQ